MIHVIARKNGGWEEAYRTMLYRSVCLEVATDGRALSGAWWLHCGCVNGYARACEHTEVLTICFYDRKFWCLISMFQCLRCTNASCMNDGRRAAVRVCACVVLWVFDSLSIVTLTMKSTHAVWIHGCVIACG